MAERGETGSLVTLICDSMAAWVMKEKKVQAVIVGADKFVVLADLLTELGQAVREEHGLTWVPPDDVKALEKALVTDQPAAFVVAV